MSDLCNMTYRDLKIIIILAVILLISQAYSCIDKSFQNKELAKQEETMAEHKKNLQDEEEKITEHKKYLWDLILPLLEQEKFFNKQENSYKAKCNLENDCPLHLTLEKIWLEPKNKKANRRLTLSMYDPNNKFLIKFIDIYQNSPYPTAYNNIPSSKLSPENKIKMAKDFLKVFEHGVVELDRSERGMPRPTKEEMQRVDDLMNLRDIPALLATIPSPEWRKKFEKVFKEKGYL